MTGSPQPAAPPLSLWVRGAARLDEALARAVPVVGSRTATPYGEHVAADLGYGLASRGWTVVSGGPFGTDGPRTGDATTPAPVIMSGRPPAALLGGVRDGDCEYLLV